jgi:FAD:protein FMN transferase
MHSPMLSPQPYPKRSNNDLRRSVALMGTVVTVHVVGHDEHPREASQREDAVERAFGWFTRVEECCTRFEASSEMMQLTTQIGVPVRVSTLLYKAVQFALAVAEQSAGAFDPTVGYAMETRGFNREHRSGNRIQTAIDANISASYRDVRLDPDHRTITLLRPLILDLGAVAKGLAVDLAALELQPFQNFAIDAGGDLYLAGRNPNGEPWSIGIRHPRREKELIDTLRVSNCAVCTSGDYERRSFRDGGHHILDPRKGSSANSVASVTVVAPNAMLADALATAALVLGPTEGIRLFDRLGVNGLIITPQLERYETRGMSACH